MAVYTTIVVFLNERMDGLAIAGEATAREATVGQATVGQATAGESTVGQAVPSGPKNYSTFPKRSRGKNRKPYLLVEIQKLNY